MPDPVPVMVSGRLAAHSSYQGRSLGKAFLRDAVLRMTQAADIAGIGALLVHAISEDAQRFPERGGSRPPPLDSVTLMITMRHAEKALVGENDI